MKKSELVAAMAERADVTASVAGACLEAMFETIAAQVGKGNDISIPGWLKVERAKTSARTGRNPKTGEPLEMPAGTRTKLSAGSKLKAAGKS